MATVETRPPATGRELFESTRAHATEILGAARAHDAPQLGLELERTAARIARGATIAVVGHRSRGKSTLLNALLEAPGLLPTEVDVTTNAHIVIAPPVGRLRDRSAHVHFVDGTSEEVDLDELPAYASEAENPNNEKGVQRIGVIFSHPLLDEGFRFLDTPGVGGLMSAHGRRTLEAVAGADGLLMVLEAGQPVIQEEIDFISKVAERAGRVVFAANRADKAKDPAEIERFNRAALEQHAPRLASSSIVAISARQAERALREREEDPDYADELLAESNLAALVEALRIQVLDDVLTAQAGAMLAQTGAALEELERPYREVIEIARGSADLDTRIADTRRELRAMQGRPPQPRLREQLQRIHQQTSRAFRDRLDDLQDELTDLVDREWKPQLAQTLPEDLRNEVDALYGEAMNSLDREASAAASALFAEYGLGSVDVAGEAGRVEGDGPGHDASIPPPPSQRSTVHRQLTRVAGVTSPVWLWLLGAPLLVPAAAIGLVIFNERREKRVAEQQEAKKFVGRHVKAARKSFDRTVDDHVGRLRDQILTELETRHHARIESIESALRHLTDLKQRAPDEASARERLTEFGPLWARQEVLERPAADAA
jgi:energy-coupling factor transporter ATP-binding protein EcfA2